MNKSKKIKSEKPIHNAILLALHARHGRGKHAHGSRNQKRQTKNSWRKEVW
jgi:hypothetical protein